MLRRTIKSFEIKSVHKITQGTHALTFPILQEFGDNTHITFLIAPWYSAYDCLIRNKDLQNLQATTLYTAKFKDCLCYQVVLNRTFPTPRLEESQKIPIGKLMSEGSKQHYISSPMS
ncbi:hypothetical protein M0804_013310 [Polistes exclamans]|nr:hypothetical protein M0804_013310 [Polistes exclamans]